MRTHGTRWIVAGALASLFVAAGCPGRPGSETVGGRTMPALEVTSSAFQQDGDIPSRFTCEGEDISPPLTFAGAPPDTAAYALICEDPDAPGGTWIHWVLWNQTAPELPENVPRDASLPGGARQGVNSWGRTGYGGPCPPSGTHRYIFRAFALSETLDLGGDADAARLREAMHGKILAEGALTGRYARRR